MRFIIFKKGKYLQVMRRALALSEKRGSTQSIKVMKKYNSF